MSSGARSIRVAPADATPLRPAPLDLPRVVSALAALALVFALFIPPGAFAATRDWTLSAAPTTVSPGQSTVQVNATNVGDDGGGEAVGCVVIAVPKSSFTVLAVWVDAVSDGDAWSATFSGDTDTWYVTLFSDSGGGNRLHGQPNESVTASIQFTDTGAAGAFDWVGNAFNNEDCTDDFLLPRTVSITVGSANGAPLSSADGYSTTKGVPVVAAAPGVLANDADPDGDPLTAIESAPPAYGTLSLAADGSFIYTPALGFAGTDTFRYAAFDGTASSAPTDVTITVADTPPATQPDGPFVVAEDETFDLAAPGVLDNDLDADGDALVAVPESPTSAGDLTLRPDGSFTYVPDPDAFGIDSFSYRASDGTSQSAPTLVTLTITPVNDPPDGAPDAYATPEDTTLSVPAPGVLANDVDREGDPMTATLTAGPASGSLALQSNGAFTFTPAPDAIGTVTFTYKARDATSASGPVTVTLDVTPVNDPPTATDDAATVAHGASATIDVLANDDDVDGDVLSITGVTQPAGGSATVVGGAIRYDAAPGFSGSTSFGYTVSDGLDSDTAIVRIAVRPPAPTSTPTPAPSLTEPTPPAPTAVPTQSEPPSEPEEPTAVGAPPLQAPASSASPRPSPPERSATPEPAPIPPPPAAGGLVPLPVAELTAVPHSDSAGFGSFGGLLGGFSGTGFAWAVPAAVLGLPGLLFMVAVGAQLLGAAAWIPAISRSLAGLGASRRRRSHEMQSAPRWRPSP